MARECSTSRLLSTLSAGVLAFALSGFAFAGQEGQAGQQQPQAQPTPGSDAAQREQEYLAALKKCEPLAAAERQKCIEAAKKRFGQM
ncbi:MAG TPA: hypothetical protein VNM24_04490 [Burkholderiales bacterium]|jgi:hypothetical protein|nr:hypothetical protein [Burkholderiales bacterium]